MAHTSVVVSVGGITLALTWVVVSVGVVRWLFNG